MTHAPGRSTRFVLTSLALACVALAGCREDSVAPKTIHTPNGPMGDLGTYIVDVDLKTRTVTARPSASGSLSAPKGVSASLYGATGTITHNFTVVGGGPDVNNTFVMQDRIENDLPFAIGTHAAHALGTFPQDTMGVFVFVLRGPIVTGGCTPDPVTCVVKADTAVDGAFPFTAADSQPYMYFKTILEASDGTPNAGLDYSDQSATPPGIDYFRTIGFHASPAVTHFFFEIAVSAAWPRPQGQPWTETYLGDSLPNRLGTSLDSLRSEPDWRLAAVGVADTSIQGTFCFNDGPPCLRLGSVAPNPPLPTTIDSIVYFRSDSIGATDTAFIQADILTSGLKTGNPSIFLGMQDGVKAIHFGLANGRAGFTTDANAFIAGGSVAGSTGASWRIVKYASDSVLAFKDGAQVVVLAYSALPAAPTPNARNAYFWFGQRVVGSSTNNPTAVASSWQNVIYTIGKDSP